MSGFGELIKQGLKSAGKAMVKKGSTVSSKKIDKRGISLNTIFPDADVFDSDKALTLTSVWNAIRLLSESVSSLPISVYRKENNGDLGF